eukprot:CAMPEP_0119486522 /NCGR_PEP_ID=MMETSP1344-20130328/12899_1 /TAXON_ID=236787 /ORGANISM="Florenciella parvula, Strain CCMP2471" /LENGTH=236 /DNA_ID=CAMNT_0007521293 /DNA_START=353 /DNA_END=1064 /DNA_ORIENTATION=-
MPAVVFELRCTCLGAMVGLNVPAPLSLPTERTPALTSANVHSQAQFNHNLAAVSSAAFPGLCTDGGAIGLANSAAIILAVLDPLAPRRCPCLDASGWDDKRTTVSCDSLGSYRGIERHPQELASGIGENRWFSRSTLVFAVARHDLQVEEAAGMFSSHLRDGTEYAVQRYSCHCCVAAVQVDHRTAYLTFPILATALIAAVKIRIFSNALLALTVLDHLSDLHCDLSCIDLPSRSQ